MWSAGARTTLGASEEFLFNGYLFEGTATIEVRLSLCDHGVEGSSAGFVFTIDPTMAKMSVRILNWPWTSPNNMLSLSIPIDPPFTSVTQRDDFPQVGTTAYTLRGQHDDQTQTTIRVLSAAEADDSRTIPISALVDPRASTLTLQFPFFGANLTYDPGALLLLAHNRRLF